MTQQAKVLESKMLVRFPDCDPFNHLNNARYLDYFIIAREDQVMKYYSFNLYQYAQEKGVSWVVGQHQVSYFRPALLMEQLVIQSTLLKWGEKELLVEMRMWDKDKKVLKAFLWTKFIHFNIKTQRSEAHSQELTDMFRSFENPLSEEISFEQRLAQVKGKTAEELDA
jgi:YbgC/YbaW family acyl-CoA thioester hydrolase